MKSSIAIITFDDGHAVLAEKANEILKVATELFYERDFNSVGMRLIASESGVRGA